MKRSTKNQIQGRARQVKGTIKEKTGRITKRRSLAIRGTAEKQVGRLQKRVGDIEKENERELKREAA